MEPEVYARLRKLAILAAGRAGASDAWADDIGDETVARLVEQKEPPDNAEAWIQTVAARLAYERHRKEPREGWGRMPRTDPDPLRGEEHYPPSLAIGAWTANVRRRMQVRDVLGRLDPIEAKMLALKADSRSSKEIAAELGYTEGSVRTKIAAARAKSRRRFDKGDFDL